LLEALAATAIVAGVALAALFATGDDERSETVAPPAPAVLPLLGTEGKVGPRAALAVKVDNTERGRPQAGLTDADVVFEEMVEGGLTRLLAVYHSHDPEQAGPVRSARSTDLFILAELGRPLFAWSGANPTFAAAVHAADIIDVGVGAMPDAYRREPARQAPYNLFASPEQLRRAATGSDGASTPPPALFSYREAGAAPSGGGIEPASGFRTTGAGPLATAFAWDWEPSTATWIRSQNGTAHVDDRGTPIRATNVIVRITPYRDSGIRDSVGAVVPEAAAVGEGEAWVLSGGQVQRGRWHKPSADAPTTYSDAGGASLQLAPGPTWVEVLPPGTGEIVG
jgi:hypothetical protein